MTTPVSTHERWREIRRSTAVTTTIAGLIATVSNVLNDAEKLAVGFPEEARDLSWHDRDNQDRVALAVSRLESAPVEVSGALMLAAQARTTDPVAGAGPLGPYNAIAPYVAMLAHNLIGTDAHCYDRVYPAAAETPLAPIVFSRDLKLALSKLAHDLAMQPLLQRAFECGMSRTYYPASLYQYEVLLARARSTPGNMAIGASGGKPGGIPPEKQAELIDDICRIVKGNATRPPEKDLLLLCAELCKRHDIAFHRIINGVRRILDASDADSSPRARRPGGVMNSLARFYGWYTAADDQFAAIQTTANDKVKLTSSRGDV